MTVETEVRGNEIIKHFVNGDLVMDYTKPQLDERDEDAKKLCERRRVYVNLKEATSWICLSILAYICYNIY